MMKTKAPPATEYIPPGYVGAFMITALLCAIAGIAMVVVALNESLPPWSAIGFFIGAAVNYLYGCIANDVARSAWQTERTAFELRGVIAEIELQATEREKRSREDQRKHEAEIRRVVEERQRTADRAEAGRR